MARHAMGAAAVAEAVQLDMKQGLTATEGHEKQKRGGPNALPTEPVPSIWRVAAVQWHEPMNVLFSIVAIFCFLVAQEATGFLVVCVVLINVSLGARQQFKAWAGVEALNNLQVPTARPSRFLRTPQNPVS